MSLLKAVLGGIARNPELIQSVIEDPRSLVKLAGLTEDELCMLAGVGNAVTGLFGRFRLANGGAGAAVPALRSRVNGANGGDQTVAITGVMSLLVVAGAVTALGAVSLVALNRQDSDQTG
ncbi:MAG TPA: hypothetical protein VKB79_23870 [Bryobacteraceae bacterium]|nr:hypothetical protein [Bryobacteraceae bacterium]